MALIVSSSVANTQNGNFGGNFKNYDTQILRALNFRDSTNVQKLPFFYVLGATNFDFDKVLHFVRAEFDLNQNSESQKRLF